MIFSILKHCTNNVVRGTMDVYKSTVNGNYFISLISLVILCHAQNQNERWPRFGISQNALNTISGSQNRWPIASAQNVGRFRSPSTYGNVYGNRNKRSTAEVFSENIISVSAEFHDKLRKKRQTHNNQPWDFHPASLVRRRISAQRTGAVGGTDTIPGPQVTRRKDQKPQPMNTVAKLPSTIDSRLKPSTSNTARIRPTKPNIVEPQALHNTMLQVNSNAIRQSMLPQESSLSTAPVARSDTDRSVITSRQVNPPGPKRHRQHQPRPRASPTRKLATPTQQPSINQNGNILPTETLPQYNVMASKLLQGASLLDSIKQIMGTSDTNNAHVPSGSKKNTQPQTRRTPNNTPSPSSKAIVTDPSQSLGHISQLVGEATNLVQRIRSRLHPRPQSTNKPAVMQPSSPSNANNKPTVKTNVMSQGRRKLNRGQPSSNGRHPRPQNINTNLPQSTNSGGPVTSRRLETIKKLILQRQTKQHNRVNALPPGSQQLQTDPHIKTRTVQYIDKTTIANLPQVNHIQNVMAPTQRSPNKPLRSQPPLSNPAPTLSSIRAIKQNLNAGLPHQLPQRTTQSPTQHVRSPTHIQRPLVNKAQQTRTLPQPTLPTELIYDKVQLHNSHQNTPVQNPVQGPPPNTRNIPLLLRQPSRSISGTNQQGMQSINKNMKPLLPPTTKPVPVPTFNQNTNSMLQGPAQRARNEPLGTQFPARQTPAITQPKQNLLPVNQNLNQVNPTQSPLQQTRKPLYTQGVAVNEAISQVLKLFPPSSDVLSPTVPPRHKSITTVPTPVLDFLATQNPLLKNTFDTRNAVSPSSKLWSQNPQQSLQGSNKQSVRNGNQLSERLATNPNTPQSQSPGIINYLPQMTGIDNSVQHQSQASPDIILQQPQSNLNTMAAHKNPGLRRNARLRKNQRHTKTNQPQQTLQQNQGVIEPLPQRQQLSQQKTLRERLGITEPWPKRQPTGQRNQQQPRQGVTEPWPQPRPTNHRNQAQPRQGVTEPWPQPRPTNQRNQQQPRQGVTEPWPQRPPTNQQNQQQPRQGVTEPWPQPQPTVQRQQPRQGVTKPWPQRQPTNRRQQPRQGVTEPWPEQQPTNRRNQQQPRQGVTDPWPQQQPTNRRNQQQPRQGVTESWPQPQPTHQRNQQQQRQGVTEPWPQQQQTNRRNQQQPRQGVTEPWSQPQPTHQRNQQQPRQGVTEPWPQPQPSNQRQQPRQGVTEPWPQPQPTHQRNQQQPRHGVPEPWPQQKQTNQQNLPPTRTFAEPSAIRQQTQVHGIGVTEPWSRQKQNRQRGVTEPRPHTQQRNQQQQQLGPVVTEPFPQQPKLLSQQTIQRNNGVPEPRPRQPHTMQRNRVVTEPLSKSPNTQQPFLGVTQAWAQSQQQNVDVGYSISTPPTFNAQPAISSAAARKKTVNTRNNVRTNIQPRRNGNPLPVYTAQSTTTVLPPSVPTTMAMINSVRQSSVNSRTQVNQPAKPQIHQPKILPATLFPLQNLPNEVLNAKTSRPNFVQQNGDSIANTAVKTPLAPVKLWRPATSVPIDQVVRKVPVVSDQPRGHDPQPSQVNRAVNGVNYVQNWFLPRDFPNTNAQTGSNTHTAERTNSNNVSAKRQPPVATRTNNGRKSSKRHRVAVADRISGVAQNSIKQSAQNVQSNTRQSNDRPIVSNSAVGEIQPAQSNMWNTNVHNEQHAGSGRRMTSQQHNGASNNMTSVKDHNMNTNNNSLEFVDRIKTLLSHIRAEHASTHSFADQIAQSTTSATTGVSNTQAPTNNQINSWNATINNKSSNTNLTNTTNNAERKRNRTITITKSEVVKPVHSVATGAEHGHHHPPINFNVFLEWTMPTPSPAHAKTSSQTDTLRLLQALRTLHDIPGHHVPQTATKPPVNIILHVESDRQAGKLMCRCFSKSDGCPHELKEEPLMDMCDIKNEVPCCDDH